MPASRWRPSTPVDDNSDVPVDGVRLFLVDGITDGPVDDAGFFLVDGSRDSPVDGI